MVSLSAVAHVFRRRLTVSRPFSLKGTVLGYGYYQLPPVQWDGSVLRRAEPLDGRVSLLEVRERAVRSLKQAQVRVSIFSDVPRPSAAHEELVRRTRTMLRLDEDLEGFYALCRREPRLRLVPRLGLGRLLRGTSLFEDLVKTIAWTNTTWLQAVRMIRRLGDLGDPCPIAPMFRTWPSPARILEAGSRYLEREARLGYRVPYILELAERVITGDLDPVEIEGIHDSGEQARTLLRITGVGPASVAYLQAMLGHYDRPVLDSATLAYLATAHFRRRPTARQVERRIARYGRWKGLALWFDYWIGSGRGKQYGL
ncbi:MAG: DNA-3-methyladenine glycosylase family protein, partial [Candidatus Methylomirabilia bacterium]